MKLTKVMDGRWLLEVAGHAIPLEQYQVDELAELTAFRHHVTGVVPTGSGVGLRLASNNEDAPVIHLCYTDELPGMIETLQGLVPEWMQETPVDDREAAGCTFRDLDAAGNCRCGCGHNSDQARWAELRAELAEYKATRATGGPWRPADQTWVSADIEPPASASDDTAPPLFRGLTVDKKETA